MISTARPAVVVALAGVATAVTILSTATASANAGAAGAGATVLAARRATTAAEAAAISTASRQLLVALAPGARLRAPARSRVDPVAPALGDELVTLAPGTNLRVTERQLARQPGVLGVSPNTAWRAALSSEQCVSAPSSPIGFEVSAVGANRIQSPPTTPPIAVLDTGVDPLTPELAGRLRVGANVVDGGTDTRDLGGHGTGVAAVAAGQAGGVRGVSPTSPVIPIKILGANGETTAAWFVTGIADAVAMGARVINISATAPAGGAPTSDDRVVQMAIDTAVSRGVIVVAPSGNEGASRLDIPASYPHVLAVGATNDSGSRAVFSNSGSGLDLAAPGVDITTSAPSAICPTGYALESGTSFSAPVVAGAAALVLAARPGLDATQLTDALRLRALPSAAPAWNPDTGFGLLDVPAALAAPAAAGDPAEVDDDVYWVTGARAAAHPLRLSSRLRRTTISNSVDTHTDPADVFRVQLKKGDRFGATLHAAPSSRLALSLWAPNAGEFDVTDNVTRHLVKGTRAGQSVQLGSVRVRRSGVYFVAVVARQTPPAGASYTLALRH